MTEPDLPESPEDQPTPVWLRAALDEPVPSDDLARERHLRAALTVFDEIHSDARSTTQPPATSRPDQGRARRIAGARWLAAAAVLIIAVGVGGVWVASSGSGYNSSSGESDQAASIETPGESSVESSADQGSPLSTLAPQAGADAAENDVALRESATVAPVDLGAFTADADLRAAISADGFASESAGELPEDTAAQAPAAGAVTLRCPAPPTAPGTPVATFTATIDETPVEAWRVGSGETASIVVVDAATCTVRPG